MSEPLAGKAVAIIGEGSDLDRAIAVALAEAGADIAIATKSPVRDQEFATASIANEVWALGRAQFSQVLDATNGEGVEAFARAVIAKLGRCDALVVVEPRALHVGELHRAFVAGMAGDAALVVVGPDHDPQATIMTGDAAAAEVVRYVVGQVD